jgi:hypothetical protein
MIQNDYMECIDPTGYAANLTRKKVYQVIRTNKNGNFVTFTGDNGSECTAYSHRFNLLQRNEVQAAPCTPLGKENAAVKNPSHYDFFPGVEAIQIIRASLTADEWKGYCMGNKIKYRLRAGSKDNLQQDIDKSNFYVDLYNKYL